MHHHMYLQYLNEASETYSGFQLLQKCYKEITKEVTNLLVENTLFLVFVC